MLSNHFIAAAGILLPVLMAYSRIQVEAIKLRDGYECQFPEIHSCNGKSALQVHHIVSQEACEALGIDPDTPNNGISICPISHKYMHVGKGGKRVNIWKGYAGVLRERARLNTENAVAKGWEFPEE